MISRAGALSLAACLACLACAGADLADRAREVRGRLKVAHDRGAYHCAPDDLARGDSHVVFAERELALGDYFEAKRHLQVADDSAERAIERSPPDRCLQAGRQRLGAGDSDGDGIADRDDKCPIEAEDKDGFQDEDGCPEPDNDQDGLVDGRDKCPKEPEDPDGFKDDDGCPEPDNDEDGIGDAGDKCPIQAEDKDGFEDEDGCPEPDNDRDSFLDEQDKCPLEAGPPGSDGCPPKYAFITVTAERIEIRQTIFFRTAKAVIMPRSFPLLDEVAIAIKSRPTMRVRIEGHTDSRGNRLMNTRLSQARADSVRAYLAGHGIEPDRLEARGYGPDQPIETNKTSAGRDKNRRVEFFITQQ